MRRMTVRADRDAAPAGARNTNQSTIEVIASLIGSDRLLDLMLTHTGDLIVNPRIAEIMGYRASELTSGMSVSDMVVPEDRTRVEEELRRHAGEDESQVSITYRAFRRDGTQVDLELAGARTRHNGLPSIIGTLADNTERKRAESLQRALHRIIERASSVSLLTDFYAAVHSILGELLDVPGQTGNEVPS
jgi:PAS domain S-box-containing protein